MTVIELDQVRSGYGNLTVLHDVSLAIDSSEGVVALMGANGAGKTTLCRTIAGVLTPSAGSIVFAGRRSRRTSARQRVAAGMSLVPEGRQVFSRMTVEENLRMGAYLRRDTEVGADIDAVYAQFPILGQRRHQLAGVLSGGEQQMLAIARALMARPRFLMLDEPTHGLAPSMVDEVIATIRRLTERAVPVLLVEQNITVAEAVAERVLLMSNGRLVGDGVAAEIFSGEVIRRAYLGEDLGAP